MPAKRLLYPLQPSIVAKTECSSPAPRSASGGYRWSLTFLCHCHHPVPCHRRCPGLARVGLHCSCPDSCPVATLRELDRAGLARAHDILPDRWQALFLTARWGNPFPGSCAVQPVPSTLPQFSLVCLPSGMFPHPCPARTLVPGAEQLGSHLECGLG